jgi:hypothetical protein
MIDNKEKVLTFIKNNITVKKEEKNKFGEVFTPIHLINDILDKLPIDVWKNKNLKWFDPCAGIGNFFVIIFYRLMDSLKDEIDDELSRKKWIIENMLYMAELNVNNCKILKEVFGEEANIFTGDTLKMKFDFKFDIVIGNPPYNKNMTQNGNSVYQHFIHKALDEWLIDDGFLSYIHPASWRKPCNKKSRHFGSFDKMAKDNTILYLEIHSKQDGLKVFKCCTRYDWYILKKCKCNQSTVVKDILGNVNTIDLRQWDFLPNCHFDEVLKLVGNERFYIVNHKHTIDTRRYSVKKEPDDEYKYPIIHSTPATKSGLIYTNIESSANRKIPKVVFGRITPIRRCVVDYKGVYDFTQCCIVFKISSKEEGEEIANFLTSKEMQLIMEKSCSWSSFQLDYMLFELFKPEFWKVKLFV